MAYTSRRRSGNEPRTIRTLVYAVRELKPEPGKPKGSTVYEIITRGKTYRVPTHSDAFRQLSPMRSTRGVEMELRLQSEAMVSSVAAVVNNYPTPLPNIKTYNGKAICQGRRKLVVHRIRRVRGLDDGGSVFELLTTSGAFRTATLSPLRTQLAPAEYPRGRHMVVEFTDRGTVWNLASRGDVG